MFDFENLIRVKRSCEVLSIFWLDTHGIIITDILLLLQRIQMYFCNSFLITFIGLLSLDFAFALQCFRVSTLCMLLFMELEIAQLTQEHATLNKEQEEAMQSEKGAVGRLVVQSRSRCVVVTQEYIAIIIVSQT
ncbi:hypothetical protein KSP39_PZI014660 [Platanthera zijinensis]|uniref:Uncharacterized protein n=1 Tax=Platanthera zijinensis TaxID=2320716 RepID=A0AAP0BAR1_9ASPA